MDSADFENAMRATTLPIMSLIMKLVDKGLLKQAEALEVVDVSGSVDVIGEASKAAHTAILQMTATLEANFRLTKR